MFSVKHIPTEQYDVQDREKGHPSIKSWRSVVGESSQPIYTTIIRSQRRFQNNRKK